jgi:hypothetical protein
MGRESLSSIFASSVWLVVIMGASALHYSSPHDFEQLEALHHTVNSLNSTLDVGEIANSTRMLSTNMAKKLSQSGCDDSRCPCLEGPSLGKCPNISRFIIVSEARSGTTWLRSLLNSHPNIYMDDELFSKGYAENQGATVQDVFRDLETNNYQVQYKRWMVSKAQGKQTFSLGFKVFVDQFSNISSLDLSGVKILYFWRRNVLRQVISDEAHHYHSKQNYSFDEWHATNAEEADTLSKYKPVINTETLAGDIEWRLTGRCQIMEQLKGVDRCPTFHYEDLLGPSFDEGVARLESCLGTPGATLSSKEIRIHAESSVLSTVENSAELKSWFSKSSYAYLLNESRGGLSQTDHLETSICRR